MITSRLLGLIVVGALAGCTGPTPPPPEEATVSVRGTVRVPILGPRPAQVSFRDGFGRGIGTTRILITDVPNCINPRPPTDPRVSDPPDIELPSLPSGSCDTVVGSFMIDLPEAASYEAILKGLTTDPQVMSADALRASGYVWAIEVLPVVAL